MEIALEKQLQTNGIPVGCWSLTVLSPERRGCLCARSAWTVFLAPGAGRASWASAALLWSWRD